LPILELGYSRSNAGVNSALHVKGQALLQDRVPGESSANRKLSEPSTLRESPHLAINRHYTHLALRWALECNRLWLLKKSIFLKTARIWGIENV
jgi:hypothetical protein